MALGLCFLIGLLGIGILPAATSMQAAVPKVLGPPAIWMGPAETVLGPDQRTDNPFNTLGTAPNVTAYIANGATYAFTTANLDVLNPLPASALGPGPNGTFDSCGAWLNATYADGNLVRGWYHAETDCTYPATRKSVAYAESTDGGRTFSKPGYPGNQVITAPPQYVDPTQASEGDHWVIQVGNYYYLYFIAARDYQVRVARSLVSDGGRPGTWFKYYEGAFTQPGLGGDSSPIAPDLLTRSWVAYDTTLRGFLGFSYYQQGFGLATSADGIGGWARSPDARVLISPGPYWGRGPDSGELLDYPSMIGVDGDSHNLGPGFWLYYMQLLPGQTFDQGRYLVRRPVYIVPGTDPSAFGTLPRVALSRYQSSTTPDTWVTVTNPPASYQFVETLGFLYTAPPEPHALPIYDCYLSREGDHMLDILDTCGAPGDPNVRNLRQMGWISTVSFPGARQVYRCFDPATLNHFVSADPGCEGHQTEWPIGYLAPFAFSDVPLGSPFYQYIWCLTQRGALSGYADDTYRPGAAITRSQIAKILTSAAAFTGPIPSGQQTFADVPPADPFYVFVERAAAHGLVSGYACGGPGEPCDDQHHPYFRGGANVTRGQLAKMTAIAAGWHDPVPGQTFEDVPPAQPFYYWIEQLAGHGVISGYACGARGEPCIPPGTRPYFRVGASSTRGQTAKILANSFFSGCVQP